MIIKVIVGELLLANIQDLFLKTNLEDSIISLDGKARIKKFKDKNAGLFLFINLSKLEQ